jgi:hypothetical protein
VDAVYKLIVGNKIDLEERRMVSTEEGKVYMQIRLPFSFFHSYLFILISRISQRRTMPHSWKRAREMVQMWNKYFTWYSLLISVLTLSYSAGCIGIFRFYCEE